MNEMNEKLLVLEEELAKKPEILDLKKVQSVVDEIKINNEFMTDKVTLFL